MTIFKFKKRVEIEKSIGNLKLETFHYGSYEGGKHKDWTELHLWYDNDCEHCPCGWECISYEGECEDCGCLVSKDGDFSAPTLVCMLPNWIKRIILELKRINRYNNFIRMDSSMEKCILVKNGIVKRKGKPSIEFYKDGKPQYYCMGYENKMTDEPYTECMECPRWVLGEQVEKDYEEAKKQGLLENNAY